MYGVFKHDFNINNKQIKNKIKMRMEVKLKKKLRNESETSLGREIMINTEYGTIRSAIKRQSISPTLMLFPGNERTPITAYRRTKLRRNSLETIAHCEAQKSCKKKTNRSVRERPKYFYSAASPFQSAIKLYINKLTRKKKRVIFRSKEENRNQNLPETKNFVSTLRSPVSLNSTKRILSLNTRGWKKIKPVKNRRVTHSNWISYFDETTLQEPTCSVRNRPPSTQISTIEPASVRVDPPKEFIPCAKEYNNILPLNHFNSRFQTLTKIRVINPFYY